MPAQSQGLIAILDALGAATYSDAEIDSFLHSRELVLGKLNEGAEKGGIDTKQLHVFTFNDTVVIVYRPPSGEITLGDIRTFSIRLRALMMHSFQNRILFRGALSVGTFHKVDDETNTVMGPAVSDAAAWYDKADWIGIAATPHATMFIQSLQEREASDIEAFLIDHQVPMKDQRTLKLKAVNWPKAFYVKGLRPKQLDGGARSMLLTFLSHHRAPRGTESKYSNTLDFFDCIQRKQKLGTDTAVKDPQPSAKKA
jgi:hypothetical protein